MVSSERATDGGTRDTETDRQTERARERAALIWA